MRPTVEVRNVDVCLHESERATESVRKSEREAGEVERLARYRT